MVCATALAATTTCQAKPSLGYIPVGVIPHFALNYDTTKLERTTVMYEELVGEKCGYVSGSPKSVLFGA